MVAGLRTTEEGRRLLSLLLDALAQQAALPTWSTAWSLIGRHVRLHILSPTPRVLEGTVAALDDQALTMVADDRDRFLVPLEAVQRLELRPQGEQRQARTWLWAC